MKVIIRIEDLADREAYVCGRAEVWFRRHGLSWSDFKRNGIDLDTLHALDDQRARIDALERVARRRMAREAT